jgi:pyrophosphatase PpaX
MRGVLFDLDGTLLDTYDLLSESFHYAMREVLGHEESIDYFNATIGQPLVDQLWGYTDDMAEHEALCVSYRAHNRMVERNLIKVFPGMQDMLQRLADDGWQLGVVTSKRHCSAVGNLDVFDMMPFFECLVGSDDVSQAKPDPEPVLLGAQLLDLDPCQCFYVGDSPYDIMAGNAAGAHTVAVHWGQHSIDLLRDERPSSECVHIADMPGLLRSL